jgi:acyl carrier protein
MVPTSYTPITHLPLTPNGKLDTTALPAPAVPVSGVDYEPLEDGVEEYLAGRWRELLAVKRIGARDDFFALGGNSLLATRLAGQVRAELDIEFPVRSVFSYPRLREMAAAVEELLLDDIDPREREPAET